MFCQYIYIYIYIYTYIYILRYYYVTVYVYIHVNIYTYIYIHTILYIYAYISLYIYVYAYIYIYTYIYTYTQIFATFLARLLCPCHVLPSRWPGCPRSTVVRAAKTWRIADELQGVVGTVLGKHAQNTKRIREIRTSDQFRTNLDLRVVYFYNSQIWYIGLDSDRS